MYRGTGTSMGIGIGKALVVDDANIVADNSPAKDKAVEKEKFLRARDEFIEDTTGLIETLEKKLGKNDRDAAVLKNQVYLAKDSGTKAYVFSYIDDENMCAEAAVDGACGKLSDMFEALNNPDMRQRVSDVADMRNSLIRIMRGEKKADLMHLPDNTVIVAREIQPSLTASMDTEHVVGIVAERGGDTSHASILARALEIPAVLSVKNILETVKTGDSIIVDGAYGEVFVEPTDRTLSIYRKKKARYEEHIEELRTYINKSTETADGKRVMLAANIGGAGEAAKAIKNGAEGVGLFRTEFLFLNRTSMPTEEEQFEEYKKAAVLMKGKPLTIRTLDIGGDKDIPYMGLTRENNPFLGYRAIRFCLDRVDIFTAQLRAILRASAYGSIRIMIPMVTCIDEIRSVRSLVEKIGNDLDKKGIAYDKNIRIGIMVETPAAAVMAEQFAAEADFFSIGTNDLTQYTVAVDRCNENVAYLYSAFNPAVIRLVKHIIDCAHRAGIEAGMCGEAAGNTMMIPLLLSFGLDEFSASAGKVLEVRKTIAGWNIKDADALTERVLAMTTQKEITDYISDCLAERKSRENS